MDRAILADSLEEVRACVLREQTALRGILLHLGVPVDQIRIGEFPGHLSVGAHELALQHRPDSGTYAAVRMTPCHRCHSYHVSAPIRSLDQLNQLPYATPCAGG